MAPPAGSLSIRKPGGSSSGRTFATGDIAFTVPPGMRMLIANRYYQRYADGEEYSFKPGYTDRSLRGRDAGLPESLAGVPAFAGRCRSEEARLGGAEGAIAGVREACAGMLARALDPGRRCERASGRER